jgi:crotonobetainyl-CoA:carnitine CoA-transferase CaiB-like acyl-CoA transferase
MSALAHLRVIEYGSDVAAPFCARLFADLGAEVIKVEPPGGDPLRQRGPFPGDSPNPEQSGLFHFLNAGKKGVVVDLDSDQGQNDFAALLSTADVLIESLPSADRQRWGLDFDTLTRRYPRLVAVSISPYGRTGPWAERAGTDLTVQAVSALPTAIGYPDRPPLPLPYDQADYQAGYHGMATTLCALHERERSGLGQGIDISAAHVLAYQVGGMSLATAKRKIPWMRAGRTIKGALYPTGFFEVADGFICIATIHGRQWHGYLKLMGEPDWAKDEKNRDSLYMGAQDEGHPVDVAFRGWLKEHTQAEIMTIAAANELIIGPVNDVDRVLASSQMAFRQQWGEVAVGGKTLRMPKPGYLFSATPATFGTAAPTLGAGRGGPSAPAAQAAPPAAKTPRRAALDGVRVLDFGWNWAGPMAGQLLADMGAEVIRIETTLRPDNMRAFAHNAYFFCHNNRSKKSATFNIADPRGAELVRKLAGKCDVVMDNFAAGVMAKNGLGYEDLARANPNIIVVSMSMAGQQGPKRDMRGFAAISSGYAGLDHLVGYREDQLATSFMNFGIGDTAQAIQGAIGALAALVHRQQTGRGQFVDLGQTASMCASLGEYLIDYQLNGRKPSIHGDKHPHYAPHGIYGTRGGQWLALAVRDRADWQALCGILGRDDWRRDEGLGTAEGRRARATEIDAAIRDWCRQAERDEAVAGLGAAGLPAAPVLALPERDGHAVFAGRELTLHHAGGSFEPCTIYATPWHLTATPAAVTRPTPAIGEHNDYVYGELLGLDPATIRHFQEQKVLI